MYFPEFGTGPPIRICEQPALLTVAQSLFGGGCSDHPGWKGSPNTSAGESDLLAVGAAVSGAPESGHCREKLSVATNCISLKPSITRYGPRRLRAAGFKSLSDRDSVAASHFGTDPRDETSLLTLYNP